MPKYTSAKTRNNAINNSCRISDRLAIDHSYKGRDVREFGGHILSFIVLLLVFVAVGRYIFGGRLSDIRADTLLPSVLDSLSSESFATEQLMRAIRNVSKLSQWGGNASDIDSLKDLGRFIGGFFGQLGNIVYLLVSCVLCAFAVVGMVFNLLFVAI